VAEEPEQVTLIDEAGGERRFLLHDAFDANGATYYVVEAADDPEEVMLLKETDQGLESVDGDELERVIAVLETED
jgi:hypothetical protein